MEALLMTVVSLQHILIWGGLFSVAIGILIMGSLYYNPRLWLQDYPAEIKAKVPPLTREEKRAQYVMIVPFLLLMLGGPLYATLLLREANGGTISFLSAYLNVFFILQFFNLFDAVVLDLVILTFMQPTFAVLPGTDPAELARASRNWGMHLRNYLKGIVIVSVLSLPLAVVAVL
jgi:hypothetical protein